MNKTVSNKGIYTFELFKQFPEIVQAISTRSFGNIRRFADSDNLENLKEENFKKFLKEIKIPFTKSVGMQQLHTNNVRYIKSSKKRYIANTDGLITDKKNVFLHAVSADCLPIIFYDKEKKIIGVVHAGYKGLDAGVIHEMIHELLLLGSDLTDVYVGIGPAIGVCCYDVNPERITLFEDRYTNFYEERNGKLYLDLKMIAQQALVKLGIAKNHIEIMPICTSDAKKDFFSFRADSKKTFGHFATVIGMK